VAEGKNQKPLSRAAFEKFRVLTLIHDITPPSCQLSCLYYSNPKCRQALILLITHESWSAGESNPELPAGKMDAIPFHQRPVIVALAVYQKDG
jgi:hypothetical protein